jgi:hypothetical protein
MAPVTVSPEERERIYQEEKARREAQDRLKQEAVAKGPRGPGVAMGCLVAVGIIVALIVLGGMCARAPHDAPAAEAPPAAQEQNPPLELLSSSMTTSDGGGYFEVEGMVRNASSASIRNLEVIGEAYTEKEEFVTSESALVEYNPLLPGQRSPFKVMISYNPAITKYRVEFKLLLGETVKHRDLRDPKTLR